MRQYLIAATYNSLNINWSSSDTAVHEKKVQKKEFKLTETESMKRAFAKGLLTGSKQQ